MALLKISVLHTLKGEGGKRRQIYIWCLTEMTVVTELYLQKVHSTDKDLYNATS